MVAATILDRTTETQSLQGVRIHWDQLMDEIEGPTPDDISLPALVRESREQFRSEYLSFISTLENPPRAEHSVIQQLKMSDSLSYWWMTIPAQFSFDSKSFAYATLRLFALRRTLMELEVTSLVNLLRDPELVASISALCRELNIDLIHKTSFADRVFIRVKNALVPRLQLTRLIFRLVLVALHRRQAKPSTTHSSNPLVIVDYWNSSDLTSENNQSIYWGALSDLIDESNIEGQWWHITPIWTRRSLKAALRKAQRLNSTSPSMQHNVVQDMVCPSALWKGYLRYVQLSRQAKTVRLAPALSKTPFRWLESFTHTNLALTARSPENLLAVVFLFLFDQVASSQAPNTRCLYLQENQAWELALLNAWRKYDLGATIGSQHTEIRFWDFRYVRPKIASVSLGVLLPKPQVTVLNGVTPEHVLQRFEFFGRRQVVAEPLRFIQTNSQPLYQDRGDSKDEFSILVVEDYNEDVSLKQEKVLARILASRQNLHRQTQVNWRSHPARSGKPVLSPLSGASGARLSLEEALAVSNLVILGSLSSTWFTAFSMSCRIVFVESGLTLPGDGPTFVGEQVASDASHMIPSSIVGSDAREMRLSIADKGSSMSGLPGWRSVLGLAAHESGRQHELQ